MNQIKEYVIQCTHCKYNEHFVQKFKFIDDCIYYTEIIHNAVSFYSKKYAIEFSEICGISEDNKISLKNNW